MYLSLLSFLGGVFELPPVFGVWVAFAKAYVQIIMECTVAILTMESGDVDLSLQRTLTNLASDLAQGGISAAFPGTLVGDGLTLFNIGNDEFATLVGFGSAGLHIKYLKGLSSFNLDQVLYPTTDPRPVAQGPCGG